MADNSLESFLDELNTDPDFRAHSTLARLADHLAPKIKEMREKLGLSQADLALKIGTKQSQISRFENPDYSKYSLMSLAKLADAFDCELTINFVHTVSQSSNVPSACYLEKSSILSSRINSDTNNTAAQAANNVVKFPGREIQLLAV
jgi:transcriptional regulator with XRE-family HTH domain